MDSLRKFLLAAAVFLLGGLGIQAQTWNPIRNLNINGYCDSYNRCIYRTNSGTLYMLVNASPLAGGSSSVRVLKSALKDPVAFTEMDAANHPTDGSRFVGIDGRLNTNTGIISVIYQPSNRTARYTTFNTNTDTWGTSELIASLAGDITLRYLSKISLALDANGIPHVTYGGANEGFSYNDRTGGTWSSAFQVVSNSNDMHTSSLVDSNNVYHLSWLNTDSPRKILYRERSAAGVWSAVETVDAAVGTVGDKVDNSPSIALDTDGNVVIAYQEQANLHEYTQVRKRTAPNTYTDFSPAIGLDAGGHDWAIGIDWAGNWTICGHSDDQAGTPQPQCSTRNGGTAGSWSTPLKIVNDGTTRDGSTSIRHDPLNPGSTTTIDVVQSDENGSPSDWFFNADVFGAPAPAIFFTDLDSAPNSGNSDITFSTGNGAYVTIYGNFFGATQGLSTVTWNGQNCLNVLPSTGSYTGWGNAFLWYQQIIVQVGSTCTPGTGSFSVVVNGQPSTCANTTDPSGCNFTVRNTGNLFYAKTTGNNANPGTFASPLLDIRGCKNKVVAGDVCYALGGTSNFNAGGEAFGAIIDVETGGSTGLPKAVGAYPGATPLPVVGCAHLTAGCAFSGAMQYGIRVPNVGVSPSFWTWFGLSLNVGSASSAMHINGSTDNWRVIGLQIQCPFFADVQGCFSTNMASLGHGNHRFYGNETFNTGTTPPCCKQSHSTYFSTDTLHVYAAWSYWRDNGTCHDIQFHSSPTGGSSGQDQYDLHVYNNKSKGNACDFLNFATVDPSKGVVEAFNNVCWASGVQNTSDSSGGGASSCLETAGVLNTAPAGSGKIEIYNNTMYQSNLSLGTQSALGGTGTPSAFQNWASMLSQNQGAGTNIFWDAHNNVDVEANQQRYVSSSAQYTVNLQGSNNNWFGVGTAPGAFTSNTNVDPLFLLPNLTLTADFHLQRTSPMLGGGLLSWTGGSAPVYDIDGRVRPNPPSKGAFEFGSVLGSTLAPPTNLRATPLSAP